MLFYDIYFLNDLTYNENMRYNMKKSKDTEWNYTILIIVLILLSGLINIGNIGDVGLIMEYVVLYIIGFNTFIAVYYLVYWGFLQWYFAFCKQHLVFIWY